MTSLNFDAVVFDFDGVILESATIKTDAFGHVFRDRSQEDRDRIRAHHLDNMGISRFEKFAWAYREVIQEPLTDAKRDELSAAFSSYVDERVRSCPFVPGAREALEKLHGAVPLYVASGTPQGDLEAVIRDRELAPYFEQVWGSPTKKPAALREVLAHHQIEDARRLLMIGDGESDFKAAQAVGASFYARETDEFPGDWKALGVEAHVDLRALPNVVLH